MKVVVVGGGISGLAAAREVRRVRPDADVLVLESSPEIGGKVRSGVIAGQPVDLGAESMLARNRAGVDLVHDLGLQSRLIAPRTLSAGVRAGGAIHPMPARTMLGIPTDVEAARRSGVLGADAVDRILTEPDEPGLPPLEQDISVGHLVRRRLGAEIADRLVEPLLGGVYAGRADDISLAAAMPALSARLHHSGGSLVLAARDSIAATANQTPGRTAGDLASGDPASGDPASGDPAAGNSVPASAAGPTGSVFVSLTGGLGTLPTALVAAGGFTVRTEVTARRIQRLANGAFEVTCGATNATETIEADRIILATPAGKSAALLRDIAPAAAAELAGIETASVAIVTLAFQAAALQGGTPLPAGSGLLIAPTEGFSVKATTFTSQKWPGLPTELVVLRASLGRIGDAVVLQRDDAELTRLVRSDLARLIGLTSSPVDAVVSRWPGALPQYAVGHLDRVRRIRTALSAVGGLAACGAVYDGVGIPACIGSAHRAVAELGLATAVRSDQGQ